MPKTTQNYSVKPSSVREGSVLISQSQERVYDVQRVRIAGVN